MTAQCELQSQWTDPVSFTESPTTRAQSRDYFSMFRRREKPFPRPPVQCPQNCHIFLAPLSFSSCLASTTLDRPSSDLHTSHIPPLAQRGTLLVSPIPRPFPRPQSFSFIPTYGSSCLPLKILSALYNGPLPPLPSPSMPLNTAMESSRPMSRFPPIRKPSP